MLSASFTDFSLQIISGDPPRTYPQRSEGQREVGLG